MMRKKFQIAIEAAKKGCDNDRISPFAASMGKDGLVRTAWKNRALEILKEPK